MLLAQICKTHNHPNGGWFYFCFHCDQDLGTHSDRVHCNSGICPHDNNPAARMRYLKMRRAKRRRETRRQLEQAGIEVTDLDALSADDTAAADTAGGADPDFEEISAAEFAAAGAPGRSKRRRSPTLPPDAPVSRRMRSPASHETQPAPPAAAPQPDAPRQPSPATSPREAVDEEEDLLGSPLFDLNHVDDDSDLEDMLLLQATGTGAGTARAGTTRGTTSVAARSPPAPRAASRAPTPQASQQTDATPPTQYFATSSASAGGSGVHSVDKPLYVPYGRFAEDSDDD